MVAHFKRAEDGSLVEIEDPKVVAEREREASRVETRKRQLLAVVKSVSCEDACAFEDPSILSGLAVSSFHYHPITNMTAVFSGTSIERTAFDKNGDPIKKEPEPPKEESPPEPEAVNVVELPAFSTTCRTCGKTFKGFEKDGEVVNVVATDPSSDS